MGKEHIMSVTPEDLRLMSNDQVYESMLSGAYNSDHYNHCVIILNLRFSQRLSIFSRRLVVATWGLVFATITLVISTVLSLMR